MKASAAEVAATAAEVAVRGAAKAAPYAEYAGSAEKATAGAAVGTAVGRAVRPARPPFTVRCLSDASALSQALRKRRPCSAYSTGSAGGESSR